jgi:hypothetical protein
MDVHAVNGGAACHWGGPAAFAEIMAAIHGIMFATKGRPWHEAFNFVNDAAIPRTASTPARALWFRQDDLRRPQGFSRHQEQAHRPWRITPESAGRAAQQWPARVRLAPGAGSRARRQSREARPRHHLHLCRTARRWRAKRRKRSQPFPDSPRKIASIPSCSSFPTTTPNSRVVSRRIPTACSALPGHGFAGLECHHRQRRSQPSGRLPRD